MADLANSRIASEIHELSGSTPPGADALGQLRSRRGKRRSELQPHPRGLAPTSDEREIVELAGRVVALLRREPGITRRIDMLERHDLCADKCRMLENVRCRMWSRFGRWAKRLAATRAPSIRAAAAKAGAYVETALMMSKADHERGALGISLAHDALHLGLEAACLPNDIGGNFAGYHRSILEAHAAMEALPPGATDADADAFMDRWNEIDCMAMMDRPRTMSDAIGALAYARREFHQFHIEMEESAGEDPCKGDKLVLHLLDGAAAVLKGVVQEDAADPDLARPGHVCTPSEAADIDFEPWDFGEFRPDSNAEWARTYNPFPITARVAFKMLQMTKAEMVKIFASMLDEHGDEFVEDQAKRLEEAEAFFGFYREMADKAHMRFLVAAAAVSKQRGEIEDPKPALVTEPAHSPDRRAVAAYRQWLDTEARLLGAEMYPESGVDAVRFVPMNTASKDYHFLPGSMASWRDLPQPTTRAEAMCRVLGIDWTTDEARDEYFRPLEPTIAQNEAA